MWGWDFSTPRGNGDWRQEFKRAQGKSVFKVVDYLPNERSLKFQHLFSPQK